MKVPEAIFDLYASLTIDRSTYQTNPELRALADTILGHMNVTPADVTMKGLTVYRTRAVVEIFVKTRAGQKYQIGGEDAKRTIGIDFSTLPEAPVDPGPITV